MKSNKLINTILITGVLCISSMVASNLNTYAANETIEDKLFQKIESAAGLNRLESVKDDIKRVLKLNPKHAGATFYAGQYCFQKGNFENAEKFLKRVLTNEKYGAKANNLLADIRLKRYNSRFLSTLKVYLTGESFSQALKLCEDALVDMPDNKDLLFGASYASCMLGKKDRAESYAELYATSANHDELSAELMTLVNAWFTDSFENDVALEKLLSLKNKKLLTPPVRKRIKTLIINSKSIDKYEKFIKNEIATPGSDRDSLERELITFLLQQHQYEKALELINKRPIDSLEDNLLYVWALCATNQQKKALNVSKNLIKVYPRDLRVYGAWVESWLSYTEKNKDIPDGSDDSGESYSDTIEHIFALLRPDKLESQDPVLLMNLLRLASFSNNQLEVQKLQSNVARIAFNNEHETLLMKLVEELCAFNRQSAAVNILESASNQLPNNYNFSIKLAQLYMETNPKSSIKLLEDVMEQNPNLLRAFLVWCDAMNADNRGGEAVSEIVKRLSDENLNELIKRQLNSKLELLRMQGNTDTPYIPDKQKKESEEYKAPSDGIPNDEDDIPGEELLDAITASDAEFAEESPSNDELPDEIPGSNTESSDYMSVYEEDVPYVPTPEDDLD